MCRALAAAGYERAMQFRMVLWGGLFVAGMVWLVDAPFMQPGVPRRAVRPFHGTVIDRASAAAQPADFAGAGSAEPPEAHDIERPKAEERIPALRPPETEAADAPDLSEMAALELSDKRADTPVPISWPAAEAAHSGADSKHGAKRRMEQALDETSVSSIPKPRPAASRTPSIALVDAPAAEAARGSVSISSAMALAFAGNDELNAARAQLRATGETVPQAWAGMLPVISGTGEIGSVFTDPAAAGSSGRVDAASLGIEFTQPLFDGFQAVNNVRAAKAQVSAARHTLSGLEQNVLLAAATAFLDVQRDRKVAALRRQGMALLDEQVKAAEARLAIGDGTITDAAQAKAQRALASALLNSAQSDASASEAAYLRVTGAEPGNLMPAKIPAGRLPRTLGEAQAISQRENPAILAARYSVSAAQSQVKSANGALLPSLNLTGAVNKEFALNGADASGLPGVSTTPRNQMESSIGVKLTVPFFQGGRASSKARQANEVLGQRRSEADGSRRRARAAVSTAWAKLLAARANVTGYQARLSAAKLAYDGVAEEMSVGQRTTLDVLNAQNEVIAGKIALLGAERDEMVASYALLAATGRLSASKMFGAPAPAKRPPVRAVKDEWRVMRKAARG